MILQVDNKGAKDLVNNWSVGGRMRHVEVREFFLRDLKEDGIIKVEWISTADNSADLFTKNLSGPEFEKHAATYVGFDEYMVDEHRGESVGSRVLQSGQAVGKSCKTPSGKRVDAQRTVHKGLSCI